MNKRQLTAAVKRLTAAAGSEMVHMMHTDDTPISCGAQVAFEVNWVANVQRDSLPRLARKLFKAKWKSVVSEWEKNANRNGILMVAAAVDKLASSCFGAFLLMSDYENGWLYKAFTEGHVKTKFIMTEPSINPNSGNNIRVFVVYLR